MFVSTYTYVSGETTSTNFPTANPLQAANGGGTDAFVVKLACLAVSPSSLPNGTVGTAYSQTLTASGSTGPYTFAKASGTLPTGLMLSSGGTLSGTPAIPDSFTFTVTATDANGCRGSRSYTIAIASINPCLSASFSGPTNFGAGSNPVSVAVGDFNGDGKLDLAVANLSSGNVSILLGDGTGSFGATTNFPAGIRPFPVVVGDFNGDGKLDQAVANQDSEKVSILLGDGTGSFGAVTDFPVGAGPIGVAVGDFNGDGKLDLAVANATSSNVSILLGDGTGSFGAATNFAVGSSPLGVIVGDFNGDGKLDLATANRNSNNVSILLGTGTGSFGAATNFPAGTEPKAVAIGDFNGDGKLDLAVANLTSNNVSILLGDGTGSFGVATNFTVGTTPNSVAVGDFNGDGKLDLATANQGSSNVSILLGDGTGSFGAATNFTAGSNPVSVAVEDFNGDGKLDLAVANLGSGNVSILLNNCCQTITLSPTTLPNGTVGVAYSQTITASGGSGLYNFAVTSGNGTLPTGLSLSTGGVLSGTPATPGSFTFTVTATDANGCTGSQSYTVTINCAPISIQSNFNGTPISAGNVIWFNSVFKVQGLGSTPVTISFVNAKIQFTANGTLYTLPVPNAKITFNPSTSTTTATTTFDTATNTWVTTTNAGLSGNTFLDGLAFQVPVNFPGGINPVTFSGSFLSSAPGVTVQWQWAAAVYTNFSTDYNALGVKPVDDDKASVYQNSDHAGTPENFKQFVIGGARGGGGSNFTGSYSGTLAVTPCVK